MGDKTNSPQEMKVKNSESKSDVVYDSYDMTRGKTDMFTNDKTPKKMSHTSHTKIPSHTSHTSHTSHRSHTSHIIDILGNPKNKEDLVYCYLFDNKEGTVKELIKFSDMTKGSFKNLITNSQKIIRLRLSNKTAIYGLDNNFREKLELDIKQTIERKEIIEQNKVEAKKRIEEESASEEELLIKIKEVVEDSAIFSFDNGEVKFNLEELKELYPDIFELLIETPEQIKDLLKVATEEKGLGTKIPIRYTNLNAVKTLNVENYRSKHLGKIVCSEAKTTRMSEVRSVVTNAKFECPTCGTIISILQIDKNFKRPSRCSCGRRGGFKEIAKDMVDSVVLISEDIEAKSQLPISKSITCYVKGHLLKTGAIEKLIPGNHLRIFGILKEVAVVGVGGGILNRFDWALDIIDIEEFDPELNSIDFSKEDIEKFEKLSSRIELEGLGPLVNSYAPDVEGYEVEKKALSIQGAQKKNKPGSGAKTKSHIAIFGDPGVSKSVLSKFVSKVTQGSSYSSGSGSSGVGLTASVVKEDSIGWVMKPGQLPLTRELSILDEYNLISEEDKPKLQEAMSESQISINKAGISAKPSVSCGILALANPIKGIFDLTQPLVKQLDLLPQQLNRFDATFIKKDLREENKDQRIAEIMLNRQSGKIVVEYDVLFLRKFFTYVRNLEEPILTEDSKDSLIKSYKRARNLTRNNLSILVNPRFLESLTRFATGYAKLRGSSLVLKKDVDEAYVILSDTYLNLSNYVAQ